MKEVLSLAVFAGKVLCLMVVMTGLKPDRMGAVQTPAKLYCKKSHVRDCRDAGWAEVLVAGSTATVEVPGSVPHNDTKETSHGRSVPQCSGCRVTQPQSDPRIRADERPQSNQGLRKWW